MNRGARSEPVFLDDGARALFIQVLSELPARFGVAIHGYALMPNHYHLMLESVRGDLPRAMRHLGGEFTRCLNRRHRWDGPLFRGMPVEMIQSKQVRGRYQPVRDAEGKLTGSYIQVSEHAPNQRASFLHEIAHKVLVEGIETLDAADEFAAFIDAARNSDAAAEIRKEAQESLDMFGSAEDADAYADYLLREGELWSRAYWQFIAIQSGHRELRDFLELVLAGRTPSLRSSQWTAVDFKPIGEAIHGLMKKLGWRK